MTTARALAVTTVAVITATLTACVAPAPPAPTMTTTAPPVTTMPAPTAGEPIAGTARVDAGTLVAWVKSKHIADIKLDDTELAELANYYIEEGRDEGIAGDLAFVQAVLETGWFRFSTRMPVEANNYSGIGAVDGGATCEYFPSPRIGVRAQIQHLRAYATAGITPTDLAHPLVDPRFALVRTGSAPRWGYLGNGRWATDPAYATKLASLTDQMYRYAGLR